MSISQQAILTAMTYAWDRHPDLTLPELLRLAAKETGTTDIDQVTDDEYFRAFVQMRHHAPMRNNRS